MNQKMEQMTYAQFVEDTINKACMKVDGLNGQPEYPNIFLLMCLPTMMHGTFIIQPLQKKVLNKVKQILEDQEGDDSQKEVFTYLGGLMDTHLQKFKATQKEAEAPKPA